jgi:RNA polymerase sigma-70 factor (sigma-E family)
MRTCQQPESVHIGVRDGDSVDREFADFYRARGSSLRRTAYVVVGDWYLAEDLTQQAMAKVYARWRRVRTETRAAYARRAVVNECLSHLRRRRPEVSTANVPDAAYDPQPDPPSTDLGAALALLPARQRAIVALRFLEDLSVREVAEILGIAEGTVKSQTARALGTLRAHVPHLAPASSYTEGDW